MRRSYLLYYERLKVFGDFYFGHTRSELVISSSTVMLNGKVLGNNPMFSI
jgi:hypothetical protein